MYRYIYIGTLFKELEMNLTIDTAKMAYNWFHHAFPDYKNNKFCTTEDIELRNGLEAWLIEQGE